MSAKVSERAFEDAIKAALLRHGPDELPAVPGAMAEDAPPYGDPDMRPGGYRRRRAEDYDRALCLLPGDVLDFVQATQPKVWQRLSQHHGAEVRERFLKRLSSEIERRGALEGGKTIIAELNERFGLELGPEHRVTLGQMMERLDSDEALGVAARVNTRENVRLTFDQKVEQVIQEIVDSNFDLYRRITDDRAFGDVIKNHLFDQYVRGHRSAGELIGQGESMTLEFKSTLRWNLGEDRKDRTGVTHTALKSIAAFLNTEGGDLLLGVADDGGVVGIERDRFESDDKFMLHLTQAVRNGIGDRAGTCIDPNVQIVDGRSVCVVSCRRSPEPVFLTWKGVKAEPGGDFFVRNGPGTVKLTPDDAREYIRTRFPDSRAK